MSFCFPRAAYLFPALFAFLVIFCGPAPAQDAPAAPPTPTKEKVKKTVPFPDGPLNLKWVTFGFRVPGLLQPEIPGKTVDASTSVVTRTYTTTGRSSRIAPGLVLEFPIFRHLTGVAEGSYHKTAYTQTRTDTQNINNGTLTSIWTENTEAAELDFPLMLRYTGIRSGGLFSKIYVAGGGAYRVVTNVKSSTNFSFTSPTTSTTSSDTIPVLPGMARSKGAVAALGFRFLDDFNIRVTPEIRYIHWLGRSYDSFSTQTRKDQIEAGVALTF